MYYEKVELCGVNTSTLKVLSSEEKRELLLLAQKGDFGARDRLMYGNLRLVLSIIKRFSGRNENPDDLFQVGCIGLIKAIDNFNTELDVKFSTYAVPMIIGEVRRYLRDNNTIRVSRSVRDLAYRALQMRESLLVANNAEPSVAEIAKSLEAPPESVAMAIEAIAQPVSLYDPVYNDSGDSIFIMDQIKDDDNNDELWCENIALKEAIKQLSPRERKIILMRFFRGKTQMEIASMIGISQAQVSRLEKGALEKVRKMM